MLPLIVMLLGDLIAEKRVPGTPEEVFALWITPAGVRQFFAPAAVIDPRVGGEYTIIFAPEHDPEGRSHGTKGAKILALEPGRRLVFEWITFTSTEVTGVPGPPAVPPTERNVTPLPTAVELTFTADGPEHTLVRLRHYGFPSGGKWDEAHAYFGRVWPMVLESLEE
jgi:uncharacterized protein YndB with AHSA1/START domain